MRAAVRRLLWPGLMTAVMLAVLLGLGTWQVHRLAWKTDLLARIDRAESVAPVPLTETPAPFTPAPFTKVSATGVFLPDETALYGAEVRDIGSGPAMGARMIESFRQTNGEVILVDRGWVPLSRPKPVDEPNGTVTVSGYIRFGDRARWFNVSDDPVDRRFFTLDPRAIGAAIGRPDIRPIVLVLLAADNVTTPVAEHWPEPAQHMPRPPNSHLSYAITWYGLAVALLAVFIVWARKGSTA
jgi:surfeit locus 1 family protein